MGGVPPFIGGARNPLYCAGHYMIARRNSEDEEEETWDISALVTGQRRKVNRFFLSSLDLGRSLSVFVALLINFSSGFLQQDIYVSIELVWTSITFVMFELAKRPVHCNGRKKYHTLLIYKKNM